MNDCIVLTACCVKFRIICGRLLTCYLGPFGGQPAGAICKIASSYLYSDSDSNDCSISWGHAYDYQVMGTRSYVSIRMIGGWILDWVWEMLY